MPLHEPSDRYAYNDAEQEFSKYKHGADNDGADTNDSRTAATSSPSDLRNRVLVLALRAGNSKDMAKTLLCVCVELLSAASEENRDVYLSNGNVIDRQRIIALRDACFEAFCVLVALAGREEERLAVWEGLRLVRESAIHGS